MNTSKMVPKKLINGVKANLRIMLSIGMIIIGMMHFANPESFVRTVPGVFPHALAFVYWSGLIEVLAGVGLLFPPTSRTAAWMLVALYSVIFPANWYLAVHHGSTVEVPHDLLLLWLRIPIQLLLIACAFWLTEDERLSRVSR